MRFASLLILLILGSCTNKERKLTFNDFSGVSLVPPIDEMEYNADGSIKMLENLESKISHVESQGGKFSIIVVDRNSNDNYDDIGVDLIRIEKFGIEETEENFFGKMKALNQFEINNQPFVVKNISKSGHEAVLEWAAKDTSVATTHRMIDRLPNVGFKRVGADTTRFHSLLGGDEYIYVKFWASWCSTCIDEIPTLKVLHDKYEDRLTIVSLNWKDGEDVIEEYIDRLDMQWIQGRTDELVNELFLTRGLPRGLLFDSEGNLLEINIGSVALEKKYLLKDS